MTDLVEDAEMPHCPEHLVPLRLVGEDAAGRDARWQCSVLDCTWVQLA